MYIFLYIRAYISTHTPLARRDTPTGSEGKFDFISTHTPLARRDDYDRRPAYKGDISTHTPLARRDGALYSNAAAARHFYSHASREA